MYIQTEKAFNKDRVTDEQEAVSTLRSGIESKSLRYNSNKDLNKSNNVLPKMKQGDKLKQYISTLDALTGKHVSLSQSKLTALDSHEVPDSLSIEKKDNSLDMSPTHLNDLRQPVPGGVSGPRHTESYSALGHALEARIKSNVF